MATIIVTNLSSSPVFLRDFYVTLGAAGSKNSALAPVDTLTTTKAEASLAQMSGLMSLVAAGTVSVSVTPDSTEAGAALLVPPQSVGPDDLMYVTNTTANNTHADGLTYTIKVPLVAGQTESVVYANGTLPGKLRILDMTAFISTGAAGTVKIWSRTGGTGTALTGTVDSTTAGRIAPTAASWTATVVTPVAATDGMFVAKASAAVGELFITVRKEV